MIIRKNTPDHLDISTESFSDTAYGSIFVLFGVLFPFSALVQGAGSAIVGALMVIPILMLLLVCGRAGRTHVVIDRQKARGHVFMTHPLRRPTYRAFALDDFLWARVVIHEGHEADSKEPVLRMGDGVEWPIGEAFGPNFVADDLVKAINDWLRIYRRDFVASE